MRLRVFSRFCTVLLVTPLLIAQHSESAEPTFDFSRWPYPLYQEVVGRLHQLVRKHPKLVRLHNIGKSGEGRDLWVVEVTNAETGPGESKPGMWMDGNIHAAEVTGRQILLYFVERLLANYGTNPEVTRLVDTRVFYVMPIFDVDGSERVLTRHPAWPGHKTQEQVGDDLDGDGYITQMRVRDPAGEWYPSWRDPRVMLKVRDRSIFRWRYLPTTPEMPESFEESLARPEERYRIFVEGKDIVREPNIDYLYFGLDPRGNEREPNFNRNWSAEWKPEQSGAGPFPFALSEVRAVATFITSHRNIFFHYTMHSGGINKNYIVRPPMAHPYEFMPPEDNDFYTRVGAAWSAISGGDLMFNDYYSEEARPGSYGQPDTGFANDWAYMHAGIHSLLPETGAAGDQEHDGDGYLSTYEVLRWNDEKRGGNHFADWKRYDHPILGRIEIGGPRGMPQGIDDRLRRECKKHFRFLTYVAGLSPLLRLTGIQYERMDDGSFKVNAVIQNQGFLSTYVTRRALEIKRDYPIVASIRVTGGRLVEGEAVQEVGHILGKLAYVRRWGFGADESQRSLEWKVQPTDTDPPKVSIKVRAHKAGRDRRTLTLMPPQ